MSQSTEHQSPSSIASTNSSSCRICLLQFNFKTRRPKILKCGHTICGGCTSKLAVNHYIKCPWCRQKAQVVADNLLVLENIDDNETNNKKLKVEDGFGICREHGKPVSAFCSDCTEVLCTECFTGATSIHYDTSKHKRTDLNDASYQLMHQTKRLSSSFQEMIVELLCVDKLKLDDLKNHVEAKYEGALYNTEVSGNAAKELLYSVISKIDIRMKRCYDELKNEFDIQTKRLNEAETDVKLLVDTLRRVGETLENRSNDKLSALEQQQYYIQSAPVVKEALMCEKMLPQNLQQVYTKLNENYTIEETEPRVVRLRLPEVVDHYVESNVKVTDVSFAAKTFNYAEQANSPFGFGPGITKRQLKRS